MTEFTERQPEDKTFQLSGTFCFYSRQRAAREVFDENQNKTVIINEYDTTAYKIDVGRVVVNYFGTMLSDGTPGGLSGNTFVRPDNPGSYVLIGKVVPNPGGDTTLQEVNLAKEVALQSGLPYEDPSQKRAPAKEYNRRAKAPRTREQAEREKNQRRAFDNKSNTKLKHYMNKYTTKIR